MQIPKRRAEKLRGTPGGGPVYLTAAGVQKLEDELAQLEADLPMAIKEVERTKEYGDFSENAEYREAKIKMRKMHHRVMVIKNKLNRKVLINTDNATDRVQIGSTVTFEVDGTTRIYQILGSDESDPGNGKISHKSPLGSALLNHRVGEEISAVINDRQVMYKIVDIS